MKKLCFIGFNIEDMGGITWVMSALCGELNKINEYKISIVSICDTGENPHYYFAKDIKIDKLHNNPNDRIKNIIFKSFFPLLKILKKNKFDIIFMQGHYIPPIVMPLKLFVKSRFVFCDHGALSNQIKDKKATFFRKIAAKFSDKIVVLTNHTKNEYHKIFGVKEDKIKTIPNFIDEEILKTKGNYKADSKLILSSGRFTPEKGFDMLLDVAKIVFEKHYDWQWHIFGDGPEFNNINSKIKKLKLEKNVKLKGMADNMYSKYKDYGIFVLTSYREGFSLVLLEAKANSLPLVSFDCVAGPSEIICNGMDGYLIPCYNKLRMAEKICQLIEDSSLRERFSKNSQNNIEKFKKSNVIVKWINFIKNL